MGKKIIITLLFYSFLIIFFSGQVFGTFSFQINQISPDTISSKEEEIIVNLAINDLPNDSYFWVAFQKNDGGNYFGYMKNDLK